ncbi:vacuolar protein sorting-associated protein 4 [Aplysia californica]|uniref:Vacuolar protein sorting-associated protein 4 n=1 Tax=Aplysia californica TaxID=6500 RepID=A0ABM0K8Z6_APLCA|nr:vacuolar protein sorting-associated protein 4 [Aplysia californica]
MASASGEGNLVAEDPVAGDQELQEASKSVASNISSAYHSSVSVRDGAKVPLNPFEQKDFQDTLIALKEFNDKDEDLRKIFEEIHEHVEMMFRLWEESEYDECLKATMSLERKIMDKFQSWTGEAKEWKILKEFAASLSKKTAAVQTVSSQSKEEYEYYSLIENEISCDCGGISFEEVYGLDSSIEYLKERIVIPSRFPVLFRNTYRRLGCFLMYGHPGTGKTLLLKATANEAKINLFVFNLHMLGSVLHRDPRKCLQTVFEVARDYSPSILCLEDVDAVYQDWTYLKELLCQIDKRPGDKRVFIVATTQKPWKLNCSLRRRLINRMYVNPLTLNERVDFLISSMKSMKTHYCLYQDTQDVARRTEGFTGSDLLSLVRDAEMHVVKMVMESQYFKKVAVAVTTYCPEEFKEEQASVSDKSQQAAMENEKIFADETSMTKDRLEERFMACDSKDEDAIRMNWIEIPEGKLFIHHEMPEEAMIAALSDACSSLNDEDVAKMQEFVDNYQ